VSEGTDLGINQCGKIMPHQGELYHTPSSTNMQSAATVRHLL